MLKFGIIGAGGIARTMAETIRAQFGIVYPFEM